MCWHTMFAIVAHNWTCRAHARDFGTKIRSILAFECCGPCYEASGDRKHDWAVTHPCASYKCARHNHKCLADPIGRAVLGVSLLPLACWDYGFELRLLLGCRRCCVLSSRGLCDGPITRPEDTLRWADHSSRGRVPSVVSECDREPLIIRMPWPTRGRCTVKKNVCTLPLFVFISSFLRNCNIFCDLFAYKIWYSWLQLFAKKLKDI
jgi:hypothetical protein